MENSMQSYQNTRNGTAIRSSNPTTGFIPKRHEILVSKRYLLDYVYHSTVHNSQDEESTNVSIIQ